MHKPLIMRLDKKDGSSVANVRLQYEAPHIPGFLAVESVEYPGSTEYISLDTVSAFTALNEELHNIRSVMPVERIKVKLDNSL